MAAVNRKQSLENGREPNTNRITYASKTGARAAPIAGAPTEAHQSLNDSLIDSESHYAFPRLVWKTAFTPLIRAGRGSSIKKKIKKSEAQVTELYRVQGENNNRPFIRQGTKAAVIHSVLSTTFPRQSFVSEVSIHKFLNRLLQYSTGLFAPPTEPKTRTSTLSVKLSFATETPGLR